ncbi:uncharacterized protein VICG_00271 [Vittaforma corneae ATCC 50505]|uniref:Uncharacterized protein n=1 Tax=Vittaforma corneae (strain ATCC 50505) TaxID=993615 RepID=L2GPH8_VITCO|nr:uncharacterized protein VICG_00271 [Vittaforma corneae ATCC 50505]ELA42519.1 hypothetical protein VICG_00271 [Vittaforma corneae ATCC 50505]
MCLCFFVLLKHLTHFSFISCTFIYRFIVIESYIPRKVEMEAFENLLLILDKIEAELDQQPVYVMDKLKHESEKMYVFNALGICLGKLNNGCDKKYKEGLLRQKRIFRRLRVYNFNFAIYFTTLLNCECLF